MKENTVSNTTSMPSCSVNSSTSFPVVSMFAIGLSESVRSKCRLLRYRIHWEAVISQPRLPKRTEHRNWAFMVLMYEIAGRNSAIASKGVPTRVAAVDSLLGGVQAGYVKADVEGAERETLLGRKRTLRSKPKLNFAAYHRTEDIFSLPLLIAELNPEYRIFLRHHPYIPAWDTNIYAI